MRSIFLEVYEGQIYDFVYPVREVEDIIRKKLPNANKHSDEIDGDYTVFSDDIFPIGYGSETAIQATVVAEYKIPPEEDDSFLILQYTSLDRSKRLVALRESDVYSFHKRCLELKHVLKEEAYEKKEGVKYPKEKRGVATVHSKKTVGKVVFAGHRFVS